MGKVFYKCVSIGSLGRFKYFLVSSSWTSIPDTKFSFNSHLFVQLTQAQFHYIYFYSLTPSPYLLNFRKHLILPYIFNDWSSEKHRLLINITNCFSSEPCRIETLDVNVVKNYLAWGHIVETFQKWCYGRLSSSTRTNKRNLDNQTQNPQIIDIVNV